MRILVAVAALLLGAIAPLTVRAQASVTFDSGQMAATMAIVMQMNKPATFVLQHRVDLALSAAQVSLLQALAVTQSDSMVAWQARIASQMRATPPSPALIAAGSWSGDIDERALREALCQSSATQVELMLGLARDRRATAAVLTSAQAARLPHLLSEDMVKAVKR